MALTHKQSRFIQEYMIDLNATQAAMRAGYSKKTSHVIGHENLQKPEIACEVERLQSSRSETAWLTREKVLSDLEAIKADAMQRIFDKDGNQVMVNHAAAIKASELHGKHIGLFAEKLNVEGNMAISFINEFDE